MDRKSQKRPPEPLVNPRQTKAADFFDHIVIGKPLMPIPEHGLPGADLPKQGKKLGEGSFGVVREVTTKKGETFAEKSVPREKQNSNSSMDKLYSELKEMGEACPFARTQIVTNGSEQHIYMEKGVEALQQMTDDLNTKDNNVVQQRLLDYERFSGQLLKCTSHGLCNYDFKAENIIYTSDGEYPICMIDLDGMLVFDLEETDTMNLTNAIRFGWAHMLYMGTIQLGLPIGLVPKYGELIQTETFVELMCTVTELRICIVFFDLYCATLTHPCYKSTPRGLVTLKQAADDLREWVNLWITDASAVETMNNLEEWDITVHREIFGTNLKAVVDTLQTCFGDNPPYKEHERLLETFRARAVDAAGKLQGLFDSVLVPQEAE